MDASAAASAGAAAASGTVASMGNPFANLAAVSGDSAAALDLVASMGDDVVIEFCRRLDPQQLTDRQRVELCSVLGERRAPLPVKLRWAQQFAVDEMSALTVFDHVAGNAETWFESTSISRAVDELGGWRSISEPVLAALWSTLRPENVTAAWQRLCGSGARRSSGVAAPIRLLERFVDAVVDMDGWVPVAVCFDPVFVDLVCRRGRRSDVVYAVGELVAAHLTGVTEPALEPVDLTALAAVLDDEELLSEVGSRLPGDDPATVLVELLVEVAPWSLTTVTAPQAGAALASATRRDRVRVEVFAAAADPTVDVTELIDGLGDRQGADEHERCWVAALLAGFRSRCGASPLDAATVIGWYFSAPVTAVPQMARTVDCCADPAALVGLWVSSLLVAGVPRSAAEGLDALATAGLLDGEVIAALKVSTVAAVGPGPAQRLIAAWAGAAFGGRFDVAGELAGDVTMGELSELVQIACRT